jgi:hypothetical protein
MGLFDEVRCRYPLPSFAHQDLVYQIVAPLQLPKARPKRRRPPKKGAGS